jgi:hypothetical protein
MRGWQWLECFDSLLEKSMFLDNLKKGYQKGIRSHMNARHSSWEDFIDLAFQWDGTPEGFDYWNEVADREIEPFIKYRIKILEL